MFGHANWKEKKTPQNRLQDDGNARENLHVNMNFVELSQSLTEYLTDIVQNDVTTNQTGICDAATEVTLLFYVHFWLFLQTKILTLATSSTIRKQKNHAINKPLGFAYKYIKWMHFMTVKG